MPSNNNRQKGHDSEREMAIWLRANGYPEAATTRALLGHDGTRQPGDISGTPGICLDVKNRRKLEIDTALTKLRSETPPGFTPFLIVKPYRVGDCGKWWALTQVDDVLPLWQLLRLHLSN